MIPLVSVIIPSYNSATYLPDTIMSVLNQSYANWECIIIDDGSQDNTREVVDLYLKSDHRIKYYHQSNRGLSASRNYGVSLAQGDYIQFLDSDDVIFFDKLKIMIECYTAFNDKKVIFFSDFEFTQNEQPYEINYSIRKPYKNITKLGKIGFRSLYFGWDLSFIIPTHSFLFPVDLLKDNKYDPSLKSKEDWDMYLSILYDNKVYFEAVDYLGCGYRVRSNSMSQDLTNLIKFGLIISSKWKTKELDFYLKASQYLLQAYIFKIQRKKIQLKELMKMIKLLPGNYILIIIGVHFFLPYLLLKKIIYKFK